MAFVARLAALLAVLLLSLLAPSAWAQTQSDIRAKFTLVLISDLYIMRENSDGRGGMPRLVAALKAERARGVPVFIAHAGDAISPSLMSGLDQGAHMIDLLNMAGLDLFVPGNHEFDFGPDVFMQRMGEAKFPVYAANLQGPDGKPLSGIKSQEMITADGVRIGVAAMTDEDSPIRSSPGNLRFEKTLQTAERVTADLRKAGADIVVLVVHAARPMDDLLRAESGADVILSGHDHDLVMGYDGRTAFAEAMQDGFYVVALDLDIKVRVGSDGARNVSWWPYFRLIDTADVPPDPQVTARVEHYEAELSKTLEVPIGVTTTELDSRTAMVRGGEAAIGDLVADAMRARTGADIALMNGGGLRGNRVYPPGTEITRRDILAELPFGNLVLVLEILGMDLKQALEEAFAQAETLTGAFPQVSGLTVRADLSRPVGERVVSVLVNGQPLNEAASYKLATNDFLAKGGDGYAALTRAKVLVGPTEGELLANEVMAYIAEKHTIAPALEGRVIVARMRPAE